MSAPSIDVTTADRETLAALHADLQADYDRLVDRGLRLDLTRGKPSSAQLSLSDPLLSLPGEGDFTAKDGTDCRNYGGLAGIEEIRELWGQIFDIPTDQVLEAGNSSLALMHDCLTNFVLNGTGAGATPWGQVEGGVAVLCPVPGYDRHFTILEGLGIRMINVPMTATGPDMEVVASLVAGDASIRGIWGMPSYSNPTGVSYTTDVARRLAEMPTAADDFRILWDNAYAVHHLTEAEPRVPDILTLTAEAGHPDRAVVFGSTSKITTAGSGMSFFGGSPANVAWMQKFLSRRTIGPDKLNELRHFRFLPDHLHVQELMRRHREIIAPKFARVLEILDERLTGTGTAVWTTPTGGYFISLDVLPNTASRVVALAKGAGVALTPAGATFPYGRDPQDRNIRIAPTFPSPDDVATATEALTLCVLLAATEQRLAAA
ncbi:aminotransferase class I/II-fold pyridoxal phosphate-dependent enzyme [Nakamurella deserti]|uniref:aminotransferase class I/II-fold pyridoxal phosphate-dependent enzyme n=1 Tax=Nakamurella deserti TaxID=2164074 RepID=UPI000DBE0BF3|nr:aminotransferase class I/II-fold pyridoxal phosphate-dependent enzyme [Nakamurella deserti]